MLKDAGVYTVRRWYFNTELRITFAHNTTKCQKCEIKEMIWKAFHSLLKSSWLKQVLQIRVLHSVSREEKQKGTTSAKVTAAIAQHRTTDKNGG